MRRSTRRLPKHFPADYDESLICSALKPLYEAAEDLVDLLQRLRDGFEPEFDPHWFDPLDKVLTDCTPAYWMVDDGENEYEWLVAFMKGDEKRMAKVNAKRR